MKEMNLLRDYMALPIFTKALEEGVEDWATFLPMACFQLASQVYNSDIGYFPQEFSVQEKCERLLGFTLCLVSGRYIYGMGS